MTKSTRDTTRNPATRPQNAAMRFFALVLVVAMVATDASALAATPRTRSRAAPAKKSAPAATPAANPAPTPTTANPAGKPAATNRPASVQPKIVEAPADDAEATDRPLTEEERIKAQEDSYSRTVVRRRYETRTQGILSAAETIEAMRKKLAEQVTTLGKGRDEGWRKYILNRVARAREALDAGEFDDAMRFAVVPAFAARFAQLEEQHDARIVFAAAADRFGHHHYARQLARAVLDNQNIKRLHVEAAGVWLSASAHLGEITNIDGPLGSVPSQLVTSGPNAPGAIATRYHYGRALALAGRFAEAEQLVERIPLISPYGPLAQYVRAVSLVRQQDYPRAANLFRQLTDPEALDPTLSEARRHEIAVLSHLQSARAWLEAGKTSAAYRDYASIPPDHRLFRDAAFETIWLFDNAQRYDDATDALRGYASILPPYERGPWLALQPIQFLQKAGKFDEAIAAYNAFQARIDELRATHDDSDLLQAYVRAYEEIAENGPASAKEDHPGLAYVPGVTTALKAAEAEYETRRMIETLLDLQSDLATLEGRVLRVENYFPDVAAGRIYYEEFMRESIRLRAKLAHLKAMPADTSPRGELLLRSQQAIEADKSEPLYNSPTLAPSPADVRTPGPAPKPGSKTAPRAPSKNATTPAPRTAPTPAPAPAPTPAPAPPPQDDVDDGAERLREDALNDLTNDGTLIAANDSQSIGTALIAQTARRRTRTPAPKAPAPKTPAQPAPEPSKARSAPSPAPAPANPARSQQARKTPSRAPQAKRPPATKSAPPSALPVERVMSDAEAARNIARIEAALTKTESQLSDLLRVIEENEFILTREFSTIARETSTALRIHEDELTNVITECRAFGQDVFTTGLKGYRANLDDLWMRAEFGKSENGWWANRIAKAQALAVETDSRQRREKLDIVYNEAKDYRDMSDLAYGLSQAEIGEIPGTATVQSVVPRAVDADFSDDLDTSSRTIRARKAREAEEDAEKMRGRERSPIPAPQLRNGGKGGASGNGGASEKGGSNGEIRLKQRRRHTEDLTPDLGVTDGDIRREALPPIQRPPDISPRL